MFVDMIIPCIAIVNKILCHRYCSCELSRVIKQYAIRKNDLSKKEKMLQTNRQTLRKNTSKKWHFFLISRLESRACEAMYRSRGKPHAEKRSVKFTGSSVLIWTTWLFSKFYQKLNSINRFSVRFTQRPVKSTEYEKIRVQLIVLYAMWIVQKICWFNSTSCKIY